MMRCFLGGRFGYFCFFLLCGGGEGGVRGARKGWGRFLLKIPGRPRKGGWGCERPGGCLQRLWRGGVNIFFQGRNSHQVLFFGLKYLSPVPNITTFLEDRNLHKLKSLDPSCPFFLSYTSTWGQRAPMLQCYDRKAKLAFRTSKCCNR